MITEDYVSFETAKLLKEKGFDGTCYKVWESHVGLSTLVGAPQFVEGETVVNRELVDAAAKQYVYPYSLNNRVEGYLAPSFQMAMKWLREVHKLHISVEMGLDVDNSQYFFYIPSVCRFSNKSGEYQTPFDEKEFDTYEEACEAAIKYCLENLI